LKHDLTSLHEPCVQLALTIPIPSFWVSKHDGYLRSIDQEGHRLLVHSVRVFPLVAFMDWSLRPYIQIFEKSLEALGLNSKMGTFETSTLKSLGGALELSKCSHYLD